MSGAFVNNIFRTVLLATLGAIFLFLATPAMTSAHHGSAVYDMSKTISIKGTVTEFAFINPHSAIHVEVKDEKGDVEQWLVEADSPNNLGRSGWKRDSILPGQVVTVFGNQLKDGTKVMRLQKVVFADGRELKPREGNDY